MTKPKGFETGKRYRVAVLWDGREIVTFEAGFSGALAVGGDAALQFDNGVSVAVAPDVEIRSRPSRKQATRRRPPRESIRGAAKREAEEAAAQHGRPAVPDRVETPANPGGTIEGPDLEDLGREPPQDNLGVLDEAFQEPPS